MCKFFSCIIVHEDKLGLGERFKVYYDPNTSSHDVILHDNNIKDTLLTKRQFVRVEITKKELPLTLNKGDWTLKIDEENSLPEWYENNMEKCNKLAWDAWEEMVKKAMVYITDVSKEPELITMKDKIGHINALIMIMDDRDKRIKIHDIDEDLMILLNNIYFVFSEHCKDVNIGAIKRFIMPLDATFMFNDSKLVEYRKKYNDILDEYIKLLEE